MKRTFIYDRASDRMVEVTTERAIVAPAVYGDLPGYESPVSGQWVEGRRAREEDLKRTGCRPYDSGEREAYKAHLAREEANLTKSVDATVDRWYATNSSRKAELLHEDIRRGADVRYVRK